MDTGMDRNRIFDRTKSISHMWHALVQPVTHFKAIPRVCAFPYGNTPSTAPKVAFPAT
jgi:hypothetical protein